MELQDYASQYNILRRHAKSWDIDYTRYTHAQLRQAIEHNKGIVDESLRGRLLVIPPVNAYHAAMNSGKAEIHDIRRSHAVQSASPLPQKPGVRSGTSNKETVGPARASASAFNLAAPREALPWASLSL